MNQRRKISLLLFLYLGLSSKINKSLNYQQYKLIVSQLIVTINFLLRGKREEGSDFPFGQVQIFLNNIIFKSS